MGMLQLAASVRSQTRLRRDLYADYMPTEPKDRYSASGARRMNPMKKKVLRALSVMALNITMGVLAGLVFSAIEKPGEVIAREETARSALALRNKLSPENFALACEAFGVNNATLLVDIAALESGTMDQLVYNWDRSGAMFFAFTIATSIGYGTFAPLTASGRGFTIIYAIFAIPLMLTAFTSLCSVLLRILAQRLAGRKRDLPVKVFRMMDKDRSGTLSKSEVIDALRLMGLGHYSGPLATMDKRKKLQLAMEKVDPKGRRELNLEQFRQLLVVLLPDEDQVRAASQQRASKQAASQQAAS